MTDETITTLAVAVLAVNNYPATRAYALLPQLRAESLTIPRTVAKLTPKEATMRLARAGYDRGLLTSMMADRLVALMDAIESGVLDELEVAVGAGDKRKAIDLLRSVRGIGPHVASLAWTLLVTARDSP